MNPGPVGARWLPGGCVLPLAVALALCLTSCVAQQLTDVGDVQAVEDLAEWLSAGAAARGGRADCGWQGITCTCLDVQASNNGSCSSVRVTAISWPLGPTGEAAGSVPSSDGILPDTLGLLSALTLLELSGAGLRGSIASSISQLTALQMLDLSANQLTGGLPSWLSAMPELRAVNLSHNQLTGTIPAAWCSGADASDGGDEVRTTFAVEHNLQLQGTVPECLLVPPPAQVQDISGTQLVWPSSNGTEGIIAVGASQGDGGDGNTISATTLAWSLPVVGIVCLAVGAGISLWAMRRRQESQQRLEREQQQEHKMLKQLMYALTDSASGPPGQGSHVLGPPGASASLLLWNSAPPGPPPGLSPVPGLSYSAAGMDRHFSVHPHGQHSSAPQLSVTARDLGPSQAPLWAPGKSVVFVVTDIEGSTQLSAAAGPNLFAKLQEIHDNIMREAISRHGGLEVVTEGDSFTIAFGSVAPAVAFCMEVQYKLLETVWPPACLKLPSCKPVQGPGGRLAMAGPRVRMGLHLAEEGSVVQRLHALTKQPIFEGPGLQVAQEIGDAAHGGQVLLSHDAWAALRGYMALAGFPVVHCLGLYQLQTLASPCWLYHVAKVVGKPLGRVFGPPRGLTRVWAPGQAWPSPAGGTGLAGIHGMDGAYLHPAPPARSGPWASVLRGSLHGGSSTAGIPPPGAPLADPCWALHCMPAPGLLASITPGLSLAIAFVEARVDPPLRRSNRAAGKGHLPPLLATRLGEVLSMQAQQFRGYVFATPFTLAAASANSTVLLSLGTLPPIRAHSTSPTAASMDSPGPGPEHTASLPVMAATRMGGLPSQVLTVGGSAPALGTAGSGARLGTSASSAAGHGLLDLQGVWRIAFDNAVDALRFCHAAQVALMYSRCWMDGSFNGWIGEQVTCPDGRPLFQGPRIAMAMHYSTEVSVSVLPHPHPSPEPRVEYSGAGPELCAALAAAAHGGQVVLTEPAWAQVRSAMVAHPGAIVALSLGMHVVSPKFPVPQALMEVAPNILARRTFPSLGTHMQTQPGYHDAPSVDKPMAIVFVKVQKPSAVLQAQMGGRGGTGGAGHSSHPMPDHQVLSAIVAYQLAVASYVSVARQLLTAYGGYECKEPEPGKFTLTFQRLDQAVGWAAQLQHELLAVKWPAALLDMPDCAQECDDMGNLLWSGLRVRIGIAYGYISSKKPLNTGRADYFGVLANTAARVCALAAPGQVLVECSDPKAQPLGPDGQPLLRDGACLGVRWAPVVHDPLSLAPPSASDAEGRGGVEGGAGDGQEPTQSMMMTAALSTMSSMGEARSIGHSQQQVLLDSLLVAPSESLPHDLLSGSQLATMPSQVTAAQQSALAQAAEAPSAQQLGLDVAEDVAKPAMPSSPSSNRGGAAAAGSSSSQQSGSRQAGAPVADVVAQSSPALPVPAAYTDGMQAGSHSPSSGGIAASPFSTTRMELLQLKAPAAGGAVPPVHSGVMAHSSGSNSDSSDKLMPLPTPSAANIAALHVEAATAPGPRMHSAPAAPMGQPPPIAVRPSASAPALPQTLPSVRGYDEEVELRALGWYQLRGLDQAKLIYQAQPSRLRARTYPAPPGHKVAEAPPPRRDSLSGSRTVSRQGLAAWRSKLRQALQGITSGAAAGGPNGNSTSQVGGSAAYWRDSAVGYGVAGPERWSSSASAAMLALRQGLMRELALGASAASSTPAGATTGARLSISDRLHFHRTTSPSLHEHTVIDVGGGAGCGPSPPLPTSRRGSTGPVPQLSRAPGSATSSSAMLAVNMDAPGIGHQRHSYGHDALHDIGPQGMITGGGRRTAPGPLHASVDASSSGIPSTDSVPLPAGRSPPGSRRGSMPSLGRPGFTTSGAQVWVNSGSGNSNTGSPPGRGGIQPLAARAPAAPPSGGDLLGSSYSSNAAAAAQHVVVGRAMSATSAGGHWARPRLDAATVLHAPSALARMIAAVGGAVSALDRESGSGSSSTPGSNGLHNLGNAVGAGVPGVMLSGGSATGSSPWGSRHQRFTTMTTSRLHQSSSVSNHQVELGPLGSGRDDSSSLPMRASAPALHLPTRISSPGPSPGGVAGVSTPRVAHNTSVGFNAPGSPSHAANDLRRMEERAARPSAEMSYLPVYSHHGSSQSSSRNTSKVLGPGAANAGPGPAPERTDEAGEGAPGLPAAPMLLGGDAGALAGLSAMLIASTGMSWSNPMGAAVTNVQSVAAQQAMSGLSGSADSAVAMVCSPPHEAAGYLSMQWPSGGDAASSIAAAQAALKQVVRAGFTQPAAPPSSPMILQGTQQQAGSWEAGAPELRVAATRPYQVVAGSTGEGQTPTGHPMHVNPGMSSTHSSSSSLLPPEHRPQASPTMQHGTRRNSGQQSDGSSPTGSLSRSLAVHDALLGEAGLPQPAQQTSGSGGQTTALLSRILRGPSRLLNKASSTQVLGAGGDTAVPASQTTQPPAAAIGSPERKRPAKSQSSLNLMQRLLHRAGGGGENAVAPSSEDTLLSQTLEESQEGSSNDRPLHARTSGVSGGLPAVSETRVGSPSFATGAMTSWLLPQPTSPKTARHPNVAEGQSVTLFVPGEAPKAEARSQPPHLELTLGDEALYSVHQQAGAFAALGQEEGGEEEADGRGDVAELKPSARAGDTDAAASMLPPRLSSQSGTSTAGTSHPPPLPLPALLAAVAGAEEARSQREYAAEVAAAYLSQRYSRRLSGWGGNGAMPTPVLTGTGMPGSSDAVAGVADPAFMLPPPPQQQQQQPQPQQPGVSGLHTIPSGSGAASQTGSVGTTSILQGAMPAGLPPASLSLTLGAGLTPSTLHRLLEQGGGSAAIAGPPPQQGINLASGSQHEDGAVLLLHHSATNAPGASHSSTAAGQSRVPPVAGPVAQNLGSVPLPSTTAAVPDVCDRPESSTLPLTMLAPAPSHTTPTITSTPCRIDRVERWLAHQQAREGQQGGHEAASDVAHPPTKPTADMGSLA